ncbi:type II toxin-antitoxin system VapC family toxin [Microbacterium elymi]|uniref:Ribonuclease VapC n=1 Tax=Microbacterium elymi TaxID=2909587 RepID=A0ABY5NH34_9MICO|nr:MULTISPECIES: type II toxin-antitoxin system VapC family toxin [Microbacterium]UUT34416.1 type II toxin-antitoxin system VapC family toxin [Microbacterium elymi]
MIYLDTSAAVKALVDESGSVQMRALLSGDAPLISSRLFAVELQAVVDRRGIDADAAARVVDRIALASLDDAVADRAIILRSGLRTLDALHLATALELGDIVTGFLSYDAELNAAAQAHGLTLVES